MRSGRRGGLRGKRGGMGEGHPVICFQEPSLGHRPRRRAPGCLGPTFPQEHSGPNDHRPQRKGLWPAMYRKKLILIRVKPGVDANEDPVDAKPRTGRTNGKTGVVGRQRQIFGAEALKPPSATAISRLPYRGVSLKCLLLDHSEKLNIAKHSRAPYHRKQGGFVWTITNMTFR